jgi:DNA-binding NtrC family response regulator
MPSPTDRLVPSGALVRLDPKTGLLLARNFRLTVAEGPSAGKTLEITRRMIVGTHPSADLQLEDGAVSRFHLELRPRSDGLVLKDLESTNGTVLAGARITECIVDHEVHVCVGRTSLRIAVIDEDYGVSGRRDSFGAAVGVCPAMQELFGVLDRVAKTDSPVLLQAETGTGKDLVAKGLHEASHRANGPYVVVDCGSLAPSLVESDLFGHVAGAFTGASEPRTGAFARANGGTLFLDEVGELPLSQQPKLLRALEAATVKPLGADKELSVDVRVVAATHRDLEAMVAQGTFRQDLFFRLAVIHVSLPPLRERLEDIPLLIQHLLARRGHPGLKLSDEFLDAANRYHWPGNVRELNNVVERLLAGVDSSQVLPAPPRPEVSYKEGKEQVVGEFTREYLSRLVKKYGGRVSRIAAAAGISSFHVRQLLKKHDLNGDSQE